MTNRIQKYDAAAWLAFLVEQRLIEHGEPVVAAHEAMLCSPEICEFGEASSEQEE
jgi:hypothetical protein